MKFGRRKKNRGQPVPEVNSDETTAEAASVAESPDPTSDDTDGPEAAVDRSDGPFDEGEVDATDTEEYLDLGGIRVPLVEGLEVRVELDQQNQRPTAVTLVLGQGAVQVRPFAAPRSGGLWQEARGEVRDEITNNGGAVEEALGPFGPEIRAEMMTKDEKGNPIKQPLRFVGVDGPRWMLQGIFFGEGVNPAAAGALEDAYRSVVVVRGDGPMPTKQALPIVVPENAEAEVEDAADATEVPGPMSSLNGQADPLGNEDDDDDVEWVDLGSLQIPGVDGLEVRIEVDEDSQQPVAVTLIYGDGAVQVRPFAAPVEGGLWEKARAEIKRDITKDGGLVDEVDGSLGAELHAKVTAENEEGEPFIQPIRFVAEEGEGWMLQGVFLGEGTNPETADDLEELFTSVAVLSQPGAVEPGHPLPIILPEGVPAADEGEQDDDR